MSFRYVSNNGDALEFGPDSPYWADEDAFRTYEVSPSLVRNAVTRFTRDAATYTVPITISAATEAEGAALLERLQQAFEHDVRAMRPGRIEVGDHYARGYVTAFELSCDDSLGLWEVELEAKVMLPSPTWVMERSRSFDPGDGGEVSGGLNYPYDFPFDFVSGVAHRRITNPLTWACPVRIVIYGEAHNPYVYIGDNRYEVDVDVPAGGSLTIDAMDKGQILLRDQWGNATNVFDRRIDGAAGSGTYVFEPIPAGVSEVSWDGSFPFEVTLCGERSWVPCTT